MTKENRLSMMESWMTGGSGTSGMSSTAAKLLNQDAKDFLDLEAMAKASLDEATPGVLPLDEGAEHAAEEEALSAEAELELAKITPDVGAFFLKVGPYSAFQHIPPLKSISTEGREFARDLIAERGDLSKGWNARA